MCQLEDGTNMPKARGALAASDYVRLCRLQTQFHNGKVSKLLFTQLCGIIA